MASADGSARPGEGYPNLPSGSWLVATPALSGAGKEGLVGSSLATAPPTGAMQRGGLAALRLMISCVQQDHMAQRCSKHGQFVTPQQTVDDEHGDQGDPD